jgi:hypothetical protein
MVVTTRRQHRTHQQRRTYPAVRLGIIEEASADRQAETARARARHSQRSPSVKLPATELLNVRRSPRFSHPPTNRFRHCIYKGKHYAIPVYPTPEPPQP